MAAFLVVLTLFLALAVAGLIHARRENGRLTITIETGTIKGTAQALIEAVWEFVAQFRTRRVPKAMGRDDETDITLVRSDHHGHPSDESCEEQPWKRL